MEGMRLKEQQERQEAVRLRQAAPHSVGNQERDVCFLILSKDTFYRRRLKISCCFVRSSRSTQKGVPCRENARHQPYKPPRGPLCGQRFGLRAQRS